MPVTLRDLTCDRALGTRALAGHDGLDRSVTWVHVSELDDATPFLEGGELLLTTGLGLGADSDFASYVVRLADCGVAGLGFGVGLSHDEVPDELVAAARSSGLPLLEVPRPTPFIAISKAVSAALAADTYAEVTRTNAARQALTKAALGSQGTVGVVRRLGRLLDGWVLLLDAAGDALHTAPASASRHARDLEAEVDRLRKRGGPASASFVVNGQQVIVQALGSGRTGFLAVGRDTALGRVDQHVVNAAASVLTLGRARSTALDTAQRKLRTSVLRLLLAAKPSVAGDVWGELPAGAVRMYALTGTGSTRESVFELLGTESPRRREPVFFAELDDRVIVLVQESVAVSKWVERLPERVHGLGIGVSELVGVETLADGHRQAVRAADFAQRSQKPVMRFAELAGHGLLGLLRAADAHAFAESLLAPLIRYDDQGRAELCASLREWLRHHGQWDPAAARLGVHRHTLRNRINRVAELTESDVDSPGVRAEFWMALHLMDSVSE